MKFYMDYWDPKWEPVGNVPRVQKRQRFTVGYTVFTGEQHRSYIDLLKIRSVERGICPIAVLYFAVKRSFFNI